MPLWELTRWTERGFGTPPCLQRVLTQFSSLVGVVSDGTRSTWKGGEGGGGMLVSCGWV